MNDHPPIVLDIEGTIAPIAFVRDVLFPYSVAHVRELFSEFADAPDVATHISELAEFFEISENDVEAFAARFQDLVESDVKQTNLKALQGFLWKKGYESGTLKAPLFDDVPEFLSRFSPVYIYSSGSIAAQQLFLANTTFGDVTPDVADYFDTTIGSKKSPDSYHAISQKVGDESPWFASDNPEELVAASAAGWRVAWFVRPGNPPADCQFPLCRTMGEFEQLLR